MPECLLCLEQTSLLVIGPCEHHCVCYKCSLKMRDKMANKKCPVCKMELEEILVSDEPVRWSTLDVQSLQVYSEGVFYIDPKIKYQLDELTMLRCALPSCRHGQNFNSIALLKRHYKEAHQKFTCEICSEHKAELFQETKLYSQSQFDRHLQRGDFDEDGNLIMYHPFCTFCNKHYYSPDLFRAHLTKEHFTCHVCKDIRLATPDNKVSLDYLQHTYYSTYQSLTTHFRRTHYFCEEQVCIDKTFVVFESLPLLEAHMDTRHSSYYDKQSQKFKVRQANSLMNVTGFFFGGEQKKEEKKPKAFQLKDKEGVNMNQQLVREQVNTVHIDKVILLDSPLDITEFIRTDQETYEREVKKSRPIQQENKNTKLKEVRYDEGVLNYNKVSLEELCPIHFECLEFNDRQHLMNCLRSLMSDQQLSSLRMTLGTFLSGRASEHQILPLLGSLLTNRLALQSFPMVIHLVDDITKQDRLNQAFKKQLSMLPRTGEWLVTQGDNYKDLFHNLTALIEKEMMLRIEQGTVVLGKDSPKVERQHMVQFIQMLKRISVRQMGSLKYLSNFGVSLQNIALIKNKVFVNFEGGRKRRPLECLEQMQLARLYSYSFMCSTLLYQQDIEEESKFLCVNAYHSLARLNLEYQSHYDFKREEKEVAIFNIHKKSLNRQLKNESILQRQVMQKYEVRKEKTGKTLKRQEARKVEIEQKEDEEFDDYMRQDAEQQYNLTWTQQHIIGQKQEQIQKIIKQNKTQGDPFDFPDLHEVMPVQQQDNMDKIRRLAQQTQGFHGRQQQKRDDEERKKKQLKNQIRNSKRNKKKQEEPKEELLQAGTWDDPLTQKQMDQQMKGKNHQQENYHKRKEQQPMENKYCPMDYIDNTNIKTLKEEQPKEIQEEVRPKPQQRLMFKYDMGRDSPEEKVIESRKDKRKKRKNKLLEQDTYPALVEQNPKVEINEIINKTKEEPSLYPSLHEVISQPPPQEDKISRKKQKQKAYEQKKQEELRLKEEQRRQEEQRKKEQEEENQKWLKEQKVIHQKKRIQEPPKKQEHYLEKYKDDYEAEDQVVQFNYELMQHNPLQKLTEETKPKGKGKAKKRKEEKKKEEKEEELYPALGGNEVVQVSSQWEKGEKSMVIMSKGRRKQQVVCGGFH